MNKKIIIEPKAFPLQHKLLEVWKYRELLGMLALRDFRVKYAQTFLGFSWAFINPLINLVLLSFVFHKIAQVSTEGIPPLLYTITGLVAWTYFAEVFSSAGASIIGAQNMVKKVYFPRLIIPLAKAITALIDLGIVLLLLFLLLLYYRFPITSYLLYFPLFLLLSMLAGLAGGIWLSALTVRFRDFQYISPVILRIGLFLTPIAYSASTVPEAYQFWYFLNPLATICEGFRWSILGIPANLDYLWLGSSIIIILFISGIYYFNKVETIIADVL